MWSCGGTTSTSAGPPGRNSVSTELDPRTATWTSFVPQKRHKRPQRWRSRGVASVYSWITLHCGCD
eukprot:6823193-Lingulodinium_polyedra.AAC.1